MSKFWRVTISGLLLCWLGWRSDWGRVIEVFSGLRLELWLAAVGLYVVAQFVSGLRWQVLAEPLGFQGSLRRFTGIYFIGMFFNLILPTSVGGDVIRAWYLDGKSGRRAAALLSVFMDRLSGLVVLLCLALVGELLSPVPIPQWIRLSVLAAVGSAVVGWCLLPRLTRFLPARHQTLSSDVLRSFSRVLHPAPLAMSLLIQSLNVVIVWLVGLAIAAPVPGSYYWIFVPMVSLLTMLPVSINGMGVREGATMLFLAPFAPADTAMILALLWFTVTVAVSLLGGLVYVFGRFPRVEVHSDAGSLGHHSDQGRARQPRAAA